MRRDTDVLHVGDCSRDAQSVNGGVVSGEECMLLVAVDADHRVTDDTADREQVATDAAAKVEDSTVDATEPTGPMTRDDLARRLLEPGPGEEHGVGAFELLPRSLSQRCLGTRRGSE